MWCVTNSVTSYSNTPAQGAEVAWLSASQLQSRVASVEKWLIQQVRARKSQSVVMCLHSRVTRGSSVQLQWSRQRCGGWSIDPPPPSTSASTPQPAPGLQHCASPGWTLASRHRPANWLHGSHITQQSVNIFISLQRSCRPWSRAILIPVCRRVSRYQLLSPVYLFVPCMMYTLHTTLASGENMLDSTARRLWTRVCE